MTSRKITYSSDAVHSERIRAGQEKYITSRKPRRLSQPHSGGEMKMDDTHRLIEFVTALYRLTPGPLRFNDEDGQNLRAAREALRELQSLREENERLREDLNIIAKGVVDSGLRYEDRDWACVECHSSSDILIDGFQCYYHRAKKIMEAGHD